MNIRLRENINENDRVNLGNGDWTWTPRFVGVKRFNSVGFSQIFVCTSKVEGRNGIKPGDTVYFKANNKRGVNHLGRTDESMGSCEDLGEVFGYYLIRNYVQKLGDKAVIEPTVYDFAEYSDEKFWRSIAEQTMGMVKSDRLYGCVTKHCLDEGAEIMHGHLILGQLFDKKECFRSGNNTLANYQLGLEKLASSVMADGQEMILDPMSIRYLSNVMFWDYFYSNSDRHCKNITFQTINLGDGKVLLKPTPVLDNGGGLALQSPNCLNTYQRQIQSITENGKMVEKVDGLKNTFDCTLDFYVGAGSFKDPEICARYEELEYVEQLAVLLSQNKILFNDFKNVVKKYLNGEVETTALNGVSFKIYEGEVVIFLGTSGAGKSTALNLLGGLDKATSGSIIVDGVDITQYNDSKLLKYRREKIGFIFQFYNLIQTLNAKDNVD